MARKTGISTITRIEGGRTPGNSVSVEDGVIKEITIEKETPLTVSDLIVYMATLGVPIDQIFYRPNINMPHAKQPSIEERFSNLAETLTHVAIPDADGKLLATLILLPN